MFKYREMTESDNGVVAALVRDNLKRYKLDIPGTVYFDEGLDTLSDYYGNDERRYYVRKDCLLSAGWMGSRCFSACTGRA